MLQDRVYLGDLVPELTDSGDVRVFIGTENQPDRDARRVARPGAIRPPGRAMGVVGVLGPTRMAYPHAISTVRYVSGLMNELVDHLYA